MPQTDPVPPLLEMEELFNSSDIEFSPVQKRYANAGSKSTTFIGRRYLKTAYPRREYRVLLIPGDPPALRSTRKLEQYVLGHEPWLMGKTDPDEEGRWAEAYSD